MRSITTQAGHLFPLATAASSQPVASNKMIDDEPQLEAESVFMNPGHSSVRLLRILMTFARKIPLAAYLLAGLMLGTPAAAFLITQSSPTKAAVILRGKSPAVQTKQWTSNPLPPGAYPDVAIFGKNGEQFLAGRGHLLVTRDQGKSWSRLAGGSGYYRITSDGGVTYRNSERNQMGAAQIDIAELCGIEAGAVTDSGRLYLKTACEHTTQLWSIPVNGPGSWHVTGFTYLSEPTDGVYTPGTDLIARGNLVAITGITAKGALIFTTSDDGFSWRPLAESGAPSAVRAFDFLDNTRGVLLSASGELMMTVNGGKDWSANATLPPATAKSGNSIRFVGPNALLIAGNHGMVLASKDKGAHWRSYSIEPSIDWHNIVAGDDGRAWVSGNSKVVIETADGGVTWLRAKLPLENSVYSRLTTDGRHGWTTSDGGFIWHSPGP